MEREVMENGLIHLFSENGVRDIRTDQIYSEVIIKPQYEKYFVEA